MAVQGECVYKQEKGSDIEIPRVSNALRRLRRERNMSLQQLARLSGVSVGMLSQIERDRANPSLKTIARIRAALGVPLSALFDEEPSVVLDEPFFLRRAGLRPHLEFGDGRLVKELLSPHAASRDLQMMLINIPAKTGSGDASLSYSSEKGGFVVEGEVLLRVAGREALLHKGDSFQFDGLQPHAFYNPGTRVAQLLWIIVQTSQNSTCKTA